MTNLLDNWEEVLAQEVKAMKKRPLPRKTARLKTFVSSLLQAQREKDAEIVKKLIKKETPTHGSCCICQGCGSDKDQCWCTVNLWLDAASKEILNQSNDE